MARMLDRGHAGPMATLPNATVSAGPTPPAIPTQTTRPAEPTATATPRPSDEEIRDYAHHLYVQRGSQPGHAGDDWLEAAACLAAAIPPESTRTRLHRHTQLTERAALPLVKHGRT